MLLSIEIKCILPLSLASLLLFFSSFSSSFTVFLCSGWLFTHRFLLAPSLCPLSICSSAVCVCMWLFVCQYQGPQQSCNIWFNPPSDPPLSFPFSSIHLHFQIQAPPHHPSPPRIESITGLLSSHHPPSFGTSGCQVLNLASLLCVCFLC